MSAPERLWPPAAVTGIGSMPGTQPLESAALIFGELPELPHLAELPERGPGADMIGRSAALLVDLPVQLEPSGWRFTSHPGHDLRRAHDFLRRDLDAMEQYGSNWTGVVKVQAAGPVTLGASLEVVGGHRAMSDHGALREIAESLREGIAGHVSDVRSRLPGATIVLQLDEPSVPGALMARIPTASGYGTLPALDPILARTVMTTVLSAVAQGARVVHCCAAQAPVALFVEAGADAVAIDLDELATSELDALGAAIDNGTSIWLGALSTRGELPDAGAVAERVWSWWNQLGFAPGQLRDSLVVTPGCGLASLSPAQARTVYSVLRETGRRLAES